MLLLLYKMLFLSYRFLSESRFSFQSSCHKLVRGSVITAITQFSLVTSVCTSDTPAFNSHIHNMADTVIPCLNNSWNDASFSLVAGYNTGNIGKFSYQNSFNNYASGYRLIDQTLCTFCVSVWKPFLSWQKVPEATN